MRNLRNAFRYRGLRTSILLLVLLGVGFWLYQHTSSTAANWSWEDQIKMELDMATAAQISPGTVPEIDRTIPETETALFGLG